MASRDPADPILLRWSEFVPTTDVMDPLGLSLRGSARLAARLLFCITSVTPRARYFSFLPWCVDDYRRRERGKSLALGLRDAIFLREQALTLGCVAHHEGEACPGGALVGTNSAKKWFRTGRDQANFGRMSRFSKNPALDIYFNSLVNLGMFVTNGNLPDDEAEVEFSFDDLELSPLGLNVTESYGSAVEQLGATEPLAARNRTCSVADLNEFGRVGGLCGVAGADAADRELLRTIFFALDRNPGDSHHVRRTSLLLILELARQLGSDGWIFREGRFSGAVYYGEVVSDDSRFEVTIPPVLADVAARWRMFYFHHYLGVALEGIFTWLVSHLGGCGLTGANLCQLVASLDAPAVSEVLTELFGVEITAFGRSTPAGLFAAVGVPAGALDLSASEVLDRAVPSWSPLAEDRLEDLIRSNEHLASPVGLAMPLVLLATTLGRYARWEGTNFGRWLATAATDPHLDLTPPVVSAGLARRFGSWWSRPWAELAEFVLARYAVRQHQAMAFEKGRAGDRCLLQVDGDTVRSTGGYERVGMGSPRFRSAVQGTRPAGLLITTSTWAFECHPSLCGSATRVRGTTMSGLQNPRAGPPYFRRGDRPVKPPMFVVLGGWAIWLFGDSRRGSEGGIHSARLVRFPSPSASSRPTSAPARRSARASSRHP